MKKTALVIQFLVLLGGMLLAQSGIYAGGPTYYGREYSIDELKNSGFQFIVVWTIHINADGDLNYNGEFLLVQDGIYLGDATYPDFAADMSRLKTAPTSINWLEAGLSAWASTTFDNIRDLVNSEGTGPGSTLYENFKALREAVPAIDAISFDDEKTYDDPTATKFAIMLGHLGFKVSLCPYTRSTFWSNVEMNTNDSLMNTITDIHLQCYAGGSGNNPCTWEAYFTEGTNVMPGVDTNTPASVKNEIKAWVDQCGITGGWLWLYDDIDNSSLVKEYADSINSALSITYDLNAKPGNPIPAIGSIELGIDTMLSWTAGTDADSQKVYFGTSFPLEYQVTQTGTTFNPGTLAGNTKYYWRVDQVTSEDVITGAVWWFHTVYPVPGLASGPVPVNDAEDIHVSQDLAWASGQYATSHDVYFGTAAGLDTSDFVGTVTKPSFKLDPLIVNTKYYWRVDSRNATGVTTGTVWSFTTGSAPLDTNDNALLFDGANDYVDCGNDASLQITGKSITLEAWVKAMQFKDAVWKGCVIAKDQMGPDAGYMIRIGDNGKINFNIGSGSWNELATAEILETNIWYHVAATYDGSNMRIYVNGIQEAARTGTFSIENATKSPLFIGNSPGWPDRSFDGVIDEVRVWNIVRTPQQIIATMNKELDDKYYSTADSGLVGYWRLNEGNGQIASDLSSSQNHGKLGSTDGEDSNDPVWVTPGAPLTPTTIDNQNKNIQPTEFRLGQNYPNPFNPTTSIQYTLKGQSNVVLKVYNILGQEIVTLVNEEQNYGLHTVVWNGKDNQGRMVNTGVYIYQVHTERWTESRKMILMK